MSNNSELAEAKRIKLVISDFHVSRGKWLRDGRRNPLEDFHQDERFREFLDFYSTGYYADAEVELIVNGDFFDPLAVLPLPEDGRKYRIFDFPREVEEAPAVQKYKTICQGHPVVFAALSDFLVRGKKIIFRWGNHDASLLWPKVQEFVRETLSPPNPEQLVFQVKPYIFDRICVDHGHQHEIMHHFDMHNLFIRRKMKGGNEALIQNLPFGSFFVAGFMNKLKLKKSYINQIYPIGNYIRLSIFMEPITFLLESIQVAWFFFKMRFITHPKRFARLRKTILILREIVNRPSLEEEAGRIFEEAPTLPYDTIIMGHNHKAATRIFPDGKQYVNTGCWTPITSLDLSNLGHRILRTYALIEYVDGKARVTLKIWNGQPQITDDYA